MSAPVRLAPGTSFAPVVAITGHHLPVISDYAPDPNLDHFEQRRMATNRLQSIAIYAEINAGELNNEQLILLTLIAWKKHTETAQTVARNVAELRKRLKPSQYKAFLGFLPGWMV